MSYLTISAAGWTGLLTCSCRSGRVRWGGDVWRCRPLPSPPRSCPATAWRPSCARRTPSV